MFRALLWKEWRELWVLPVAAVPLAAMSFFLTKLNIPRLTPVVWDTGFMMWFLGATLYIPTHVFAREREMDTAGFLLSRPLDQFRLWWVRLFIGISALVAVGAILYIVITALSRFYEIDNPYREYQIKAIRISINLGLILLSLGCLYAALIGKQLRAMAGVVLTFLIVPAIAVSFLITSSPSFHLTNFLQLLIRNFWYGISRSCAPALAVCPALLLASLAVYARGNLWKRTKACIGLVYSLTALAAFIPTAVGVWSLFPPLHRVFEQRTPQILMLDQSEDQTRMLLLIYDQNALVTLDLSMREASIIDEGNIRWGAMLKRNGEEIEYRKVGYFGRTHWLVSDFDGSNKRELSSAWEKSSRHWAQRNRSPDGKYGSLVKNPNARTGEVGYVAITDPEGNFVHKHEFPILEGGNVRSVGWDSEDRFYFTHSSTKKIPALWRMYPANGTLEEVSFFPEDVRSPGAIRLSPDGKWIQFGYYVNERKRYQGWLCNISSEECFLVSDYTNSFTWSNDNRRLAFVEDIPGRLDSETHTESDEDSFPRLIIYDLETRERSSIPLDGTWRAWVSEWSPSGDYLLLNIEKYYDEAGNIIQSKYGSKELYIFTLASGRLEEVEPPAGSPAPEYRWWHWGSDKLRWTMDNRLIWPLRGKLIATNFDGSNPQELFRVENGKYYLYGEEQG